MQDARSKDQNLPALCLLLRTVIQLKISGIANVSKSEFTLRRSSLDITLGVISDKSSKGRLVMWSGMAAQNTEVILRYLLKRPPVLDEDGRRRADLGRQHSGIDEKGRT